MRIAFRRQASRNTQRQFLRLALPCLLSELMYHWKGDLQRGWYHDLYMCASMLQVDMATLGVNANINYDVVEGWKFVDGKLKEIAGQISQLAHATPNREAFVRSTVEKVGWKKGARLTATNGVLWT